jgi:hypothetical protein
VLDEDLLVCFQHTVDGKVERELLTQTAHDLEAILLRNGLAYECAEVDSNHHGPSGPQGPQICQPRVDAYRGV